ncbi:MAG TPA: T9SS type A sorting domain-containing protein [Candidatus Kapabacteria bacterium]|nr:T9SS type A sorting domain-containing protein [Candidatus Kapabacteria bacterium]
MRTTSINRLAFAMLICCGLFLLYSNAWAQCPDSTGPSPNPDLCPWNTTSCYSQVPGTGCMDSVYYCYRTCSDTAQIWVYAVVPDSTSSCDSINPVNLIWAARDQAITDAAAKALIEVEGCIKGGGTLVTSYIPGCWEASHTSGNPTGSSYQFNSCWTVPPCYCQETCQICYVGPPEIYNIWNCVNSGTTGCACQGPPFPNSGWSLNLCYSVECQPNPGEIEQGHQPDAIQHALGVAISNPLDSSLKLFPNPATEQLTVTSLRAGMQIQIVDVLGREVMSGVIPTNGPLGFDVSKLPNGTYYVSEGQTELKFVKN